MIEPWRGPVRAVQAALTLSLVALSAWGQEQRAADSARVVIVGRVRDFATKNTIAGARVSAAGGVAIVTDDDGLFTLEVSTAGRVTLFVRRLGYDSASVDVDAPTPTGTRYLFELHRAGETLDTVTVAERAASWSPKLEGFEHRLATHNSGTFFTHQQIEQRNPLTVSDVVRRAVSTDM